MKTPKLSALVVIFMLVPLGPLAIDVFLPSLPQMVEYFEASNSEIQFTISIYVLSLGFAQLIAGPISDKYGRRTSILIGVVLYGLASLLVTLSNTVVHLYVYRIIQGIGAAFTMVSALAWIRDHFNGVQAAKWLSYMGGVTSAIPTIAPLLGSLLALYWGWNGGFYAMALVSVVILFLTISFISSEKPCTFTMDSEDTSQITCNVKSILSNRQFMTFSFANMISFGGLISYVAISPIVAIKEAGFSQITFSILFGLIGGAQIIASLIAPKAMQFIGRKITVLSGLLMIITAGVALTVVDVENAYVFFFLSGIGCAGFSVISGAATSLSLEPFKYCAGLATSLDGFIRMVGGAIIAVIVSSLPVNSYAQLGTIFMISIVPAVLILNSSTKTKSVQSA